MQKLPQAEFLTTHTFADGLYSRQMLIPAGALLVGKVHKREHLNIIPVGDITVWTDEGMKRIVGPWMMKSKPGTKRVGYAHADTIWITVHATVSETQDLALIEQELVEDDPSSMYAIGNKLKPMALEHQ